jgi:hypothetical protein
MSSFRLAATLVVLGGAGLCVALSAQQPPAPSRQTRFTGRAIQASRHDLSPALRDLPPDPDAREGDEKGAHAPLPLPRRPRAAAGFRDPAVQDSAPAALLAAPAVSFEGVNNVDGVLPPDVNGDVGPNHYVQWVNLSYAVYNKTGTKLVGPLKGSQLFSGFTGPCSTRNDGDPIALYDEISDRWMLSQFALPNYPSGPFYQCIAVSRTGDPTGQYWRYEFKISDTKLNDYPKFGVWPTGYFMSVNQFSGNSFAGAGVAAFERSKMLDGLAARMYYVDTNDTTLGGMLPADLDKHLNGGRLPPDNTPNVFMQFDDAPAQLQVWKFDVTWGTTATGAFSKVTNLPVAAFDSNMCNYARSCIPQSGTTRKLDAISDRLMYRLQYRNFGDYESFVTNQTVDVNNTDRAGVRWYEVRRTSGAFSVHQQGTWSPDATHRWMGSAAMDKAGNLAVAYNASSSTIYPSIRYAARLAGDPIGSLAQGEQDILAGVGSQTSSLSRWGDYSNLAVDPDGCTFWATLEYSNQGNILSTAPWRTRIAAFTLPGCASSPTAPSAPMLTATASNTNVTLNWTNSTGETNYDVQGCTGNGCTPETFATVAADVLTYTDTPPASSSPYTYRVNARNAVGSTSSNTVAVTFPPATASLAAPSGLTAAMQGKSLRVDWVDNASGESRFEVEKTAGAVVTIIAAGGANTIRYVDSQVTSGSTYSYRARACDAGTTCSAWSNSASARAR